MLRAGRFVIATGSRPAIPPVPGLAEAEYLTSESVFDLETLPGRLAVLGGGAVGCELAQAFARLGSQVTVVEAAPRLLPAADPAVSRLLEEVFRADGISVRAGVAAASVSHDEKGVVLALACGRRRRRTGCWSPPAASPLPAAWAWRTPGSAWTSTAASSPTGTWPPLGAGSTRRAM